MQTRFIVTLLASLLAAFGTYAGDCFAAPDDYIGDSNIYVGSTDQRARPNVLFILDTSLATLNPAGTGSYSSPFSCTGPATNQAATCSKDATKSYSPDAAPPFNPEEIYQLTVTGSWARLRIATPFLLSDAAGCIGTKSYEVSGTQVTDYKNMQVYLAKYGTYTGVGDTWFPSLTNATCDTTSGRGGTYATGDYLNFVFHNVVPSTTTTAATVVHAVPGNKYAYFTALRGHTVPSEAEYVNGRNLPLCNFSDPTVGYNGHCSEPYVGQNADLYWSRGADVKLTAVNLTLTPMWSAGTTYAGPPAMTNYETQREVFYQALEDVITAQRANINFGVMVYNPNIQGAMIIDHPTVSSRTTHVQDLRLEANLNNFLSLLPKGENSGVLANKTNPDAYTIDAGEGPRPIKAGPQRPLAEALFDAGHYLKTLYPGTSQYIYESDTIDSAVSAYDNVVNCDYNHIIMITNGLPNAETTSNVGYLSIGNQGDYDGDFAADPTLERSYGQGTHFLDDIAGYLHDTKGITVYTILAFQGYDSLLDNAAIDGGSSHTQPDGTTQGVYLAGSAGELAAAFSDIFNNIVAEKDTAFVAPVVPASSTNRTISSNRVYLGLFKPQTKAAWHGNVKKYKVKFGTVDTLADASGNDATDSNGDFITNVKSYWGSAVVDGAEKIFAADPVKPYRLVSEGDGGIVDAGGIGGSLKARPSLVDGETYWSRQIFSYLSGSKAFLRNDATTPATYLTPAQLGLPADATDARTRLVDWIYGFDAYNDNNRYGVRDWLMGDVLHSRPLVFNYANYDDEDEDLCSNNPRVDASGVSHYNSSVIFVGGNDGMMHAFRDCDGKELWGFVPPMLLNRLKFLPDIKHTIFVDGAPTLYVHDTLNDGVIKASEDDKVILLFGLRRGGGNDTLDDDGNLSTQIPRGAYYALDVTDPLNPSMLWEITSNTYGYEELAETWSQPRLGMLKDYNSPANTWVVAFVGAGYDQNEDLRWGNTQTFPNNTTYTTDTTGLTNDGGTQTSPGTSGPYNPRGRGIFAIKVAQLETYTLTTTNAQGETVSYAGKKKPNLTGSGGLLWKYTYGSGTGTASAGQSSQMTYSFPSDLTILDMNGDNLVDRIYVGDTGGRMWRFDDNGNPYTFDLDGGNNWTGQIIFSSNPGYDGDFDDTTGAYSITAETSNGRKIFYKPAVTIVQGNPVLYFGTGDREHPLNFNVVDRIYSLIDRGQNYSTSDQLPAGTNADGSRTDNVTEANLIDLTDNDIQNSSMTVAGKVLDDLAAQTTFGWYIKLEHTGEKSLAAPVVFAGQAFYTTYAPHLVIEDPCEAGNLGTSRLYQLDYQTGEAVYNYAADNTQTANTANEYANKEGAILLKADRVKELGEGIPSGIVTLIDASGNVTMMISASNRVGTFNAPDTRLITPVYYMQWAPK